MNAMERLCQQLEELKLIKITDKQKLAEHCADFALAEWCIDDVKHCATEHGYKIRDEIAQSVLEEIEDNHDASMGITWDTIYYTLEQHLDDSMKLGG